MLLVTGASGRIARRAAALLSARGHALRLMTRTPANAPTLPGAQVVSGDFADPASLDAAFAGISSALIVSGSGKPGARAEFHRNAFSAAARAGVGHVVYLSLQGSSPHARYPYSRDYFTSEQYLAATGLPHTILRNAFYMDMFLERFGQDGIMRGPGGETAGAFISREDAARTAAAALADPPGGILDVTGPQAISLADAAHRLSSLAHRPLRYIPESPAAARDRLAAQGLLAWQVDLAAGWFEAIATGEHLPVTDTVARLTGTPPLRLESYFVDFPDLLNTLPA
jgi:NAD(P)H dehydrogenase (quinone)